MPHDQQIITTSISGEVSVFSVTDQKRVFMHETLPDLIQQNRDLKAMVPEGTFAASNKQGPHQVV